MNSGSRISSSNSASSGSGNAPKKMVIKPFKSQPKLPPNYEQDTWAKLEAALKAVNSKVGIAISKEELYRAVEDLCIHKFGPMVYENLQKECRINIFKQVDNLYEKINESGLFLVQVDCMWQDHCDQMNTLRNIFLYLDRSYALPTPGIKSIWDMGLDLIRRRLESREGQEILAKIIARMLETVEADRQGID